MKKTLNFLLLIAFLLIPTLKANAASGIIDIYASNKKVVIGNSVVVTAYCKSSTKIGTCEYTLSYDSSKLKFISANDTTSCNGTHCVTYVGGTSSAKSFNFKVIASGTSTISTSSKEILDMEEKVMASSVSGVSITGYVPTTSSSSSTPINKTYSTNNYLKSLAIDNYKITPDFNKETLEYNVIVDAGVSKINIVTALEDSRAKVTGAGSKDVTDGENKFEIVVTSEKGTTRKYTLNVNVVDQNPIEVTINNEKYTVMKRLTNIEKPTACVDNETIINSTTIKALSCDVTNYTLVGLKNSIGESYLYIYDEKNNTYSRYNELTFKTSIINILETDDIKEGYHKTAIKLNNTSVVGYKNNDKSKYTLLYAINVETGIKNWYLYEETENTIQIFDNESFSNNIDKINNANLLIISLGATIIILAIMLILVATKKTKTIKKHSNKKTDEQIIDDKKEKVIPLKEETNETKEETKNEIDLTKEEVKDEQEEDKKKKNKNKKSHDIFDEW